MHPKTYCIRLCRPLGRLTELPYVFYLHADSEMAALAWVARVFKGLDIEPTLRRWSQAKTGVLRIGNDDPVSVTDCDRYPVHERVNGKRVAKPAPLGHWRRSEEQVAADLLKVFKHLQQERLRLTESFAFLKHCYERDGVAWYRVRLDEIRTAIGDALRWEASVWAEYLPTQQSLSFELPAERQRQVA